MNFMRLGALLLIILLLSGCEGGLTGLTESTPMTTGGVEFLPPVSPQGGDIAPDKVPVTLYYRYTNEPYLAPYSVMLDITRDKSIEQALVERLIQGPDSSGTEYTALIDPGTTVSVEEKYGDQGYLEITLSHQYIDSMLALPDPWSVTSEDYEQELMLRRRLALYSIVNTVTELGRYSRVLVLVERQGVVEKLSHTAAGLEATTRVIEELRRDATLILTARRCASIALNALSDRNWTRLGDMIASQDVDGAKAPYADELADIFQNRPALISFTIREDETVMPILYDESNAVEQAALGVDATFRDSLGNVRNIEGLTLRMVRSGGIWSLSSSSLDALVPAL